MSQRESEAGSAFAPQQAARSSANSGIVMSSFSATRRKRNSRCGSSLAAPAPAKRLGRKAAAQAIGGHQIDDEGNRHPEMSRGGPPRMAGFHVPDNASTQILRISLRHRKSPPDESESQFQTNRNPLPIQTDRPAL
jgi:hypothetical protein